MNKIKSALVKKNLGMTYVELIVVLSIMSIMSAVVLFNYQDFQTKVDMKNLSSEIAQKLTQAQKFSMSGEDVPLTKQVDKATNWKPSYGIFFSKNNTKKFTYFTDLNNSLTNSLSINSYDGYSSGNPFLCNSDNKECLDVVDINKNYSISNMKIIFASGSCEDLNSGGNGTGGTTGECVSKKEEIGREYELHYDPSSGYFKNSDGFVNPNQGLYVYKDDMFVNLNTGENFRSDDFKQAYYPIEGKKELIYNIGDMYINSVDGRYVDIKNGVYVFIPQEKPDICNENKEGDFGAVGTSFREDKGYISEVSVNNLAITFRRPDSMAVIQSDSGMECVPSYAEIDLGVSGSIKSRVLIYPSGRVQIQ